MKIQCPNCGVGGSVDDSYLGRKVRCPKCDEQFRVQDITAASVEASARREVQQEGATPPMTPPGTKEEVAAAQPSKGGEYSGLQLERDAEEAPAGITDAGRSEAKGPTQASAMPRERCRQCGKTESAGEPFVAKGGKLYCTDCVPADQPPPLGKSGQKRDNQGRKEKAGASAAGGSGRVVGDFTLAGVVSDAWALVNGSKAPVLAASAVMCLILVILSIPGELLLSGDPESQSGGAIMASGLFQLLTNLLSGIFTGGLFYMGVRRVAGDSLSWKMVFAGFPHAGRLVVGIILQGILLIIGFLLLLLPGIYLSIGYMLTLPLMIDRGMGPWEAMEASRRAIHKVWWKVFGLYLVLTLITMLAVIPLGLGLIWVIPLGVMVVGVVYRQLFGTGKN